MTQPTSPRNLEKTVLDVLRRRPAMTRLEIAEELGIDSLFVEFAIRALAYDLKIESAGSVVLKRETGGEYLELHLPRWRLRRKTRPGSPRIAPETPGNTRTRAETKNPRRTDLLTIPRVIRKLSD